MEPESITIQVSAHIYGKGAGKGGMMHDYREIIVSAKRGDITKKLDEICADIEISFDH